MGLLEDAIREHLDLKRSRGADPTEIERLAQEALGPVRRQPVSGTDRLQTVDGGQGRSPVEYHDSTAPHWQQHEDFGVGEHHGDGGPVVAPEPEQVKRRGFLRRSRGGSAPEREPPVPEPEAPLAWPEHDEPAAGFDDEQFGLTHAVPNDSYFEDAQLDAVDQHLTSEHVSDAHYREPEHYHEPEHEPDAGELNEHPQAGGRFEPDYVPPTEVYRAVAETATEVEAGSVPTEVDRIITPAPPTPQAGTHHPILDDLPLPEPEISANGDGPKDGEPDGSTARFEMQAAPDLIDDPGLEPPTSNSEAPSTPADYDNPPQLQFDRPPRRPSFTPEPPGLGGSDKGGSERGADSGSGRGGDELQGTLEFDVAGKFEDGGVDEDVLEVTPDFLQDTPEHDRLWFEQRPPKDFDFDG